MEILLLGAFVLLVLGWISADGHRRTQAHELRRLERKLDVVMGHLGLAEPEPAGMAEVDELVRAGKKVEAIKLYRELTGAGLREARDAVDIRS